MSLVKRAKDFAIREHRRIDHRRKYSGEPYEVHLAEVVELISSVPNVTDEMIAAAWLHDVVEDCGVSFDEILLNFGFDVWSYVAQLTNVTSINDGNRASRMEWECQHTAEISEKAKTIKLADLISNSRSILSSSDPEAIRFAKVYIPEKQALLKVLTEGNVTLYKMARKIVENYK